LTYNDGRK